MPATKAATKKSTTGRKAVAKKANHSKKVSSAKSSTQSKRAMNKSASASKGHKLFYFFGNGSAEGNAHMRDLLGGKGANLAEMSKNGIPVPPGFTITTEACRLYYENGMQTPKEIDKNLERYMKKLETSTGKRLGDPKNPLLLSVRSGSKYSMPGMMDTILNLGLNQQTVDGLGDQAGDIRFALDNYRRLIQMFGNVVLAIDRALFEDVITQKKKERRVRQDSSLQVADLKEIIKKFKQIVARKSGEKFPDDPYMQLRMARDAVFRSWNNPRALTYRRLNNIPSDIGTAVTIQTMVFGNMGNKSGTGVGFTRNPSTGAKEFYGEFLINAQGEDVVSGIRTPKPISELAAEMPTVFKELKSITARLEKNYRDLQDFEFTIQEGKLYMLQTRNGERSVQAAIKVAVDMVKEKLISKEEALLRIDPLSIDNLLHPHIDPKAKVEVIARGLAASPGAVSGIVYFTAEDAVKNGGKQSVILVRDETSPDDIEGMIASVGILTSRGGMTSHAAVVARGMGTCCVTGADQIRVNITKRKFQVGRLTIKEGETITLNGSTGEVIIGSVPTVEPIMSPEFEQFMKWADNVRRLRVRANADIPRDAKQALAFGAEGIGLCRTEHMFFAKDRVKLVQDMILADSPADRQAALDKLLPMQKKDFKGLFEVMQGYPVTIRTLDPPLHEFLPNREEILNKIEELDEKDDDYEEDLEKLERTVRRIDELREINPMLGHRGCRLGITFPEITEMQSRAILMAAVEMHKAKKSVYPEIMIPLVGFVNEFKHQKEIIDRVAKEVIGRSRLKDFSYSVGTMIEVPRAALTAGEIAKEVDFFSFGTNDLTQMTMGFSRDDAGKYLRQYVEDEIIESDPFIHIDRGGVGKLVQQGKEDGCAANAKLKVGICGEHGGDPKSIAFFHTIGLDYISCSPFRVPVARLAAAQAALREKKEKKSS